MGREFDNPALSHTLDNKRGCTKLLIILHSQICLFVNQIKTSNQINSCFGIDINMQLHLEDNKKERSHQNLKCIFTANQMFLTGLKTDVCWDTDHAKRG